MSFNQWTNQGTVIPKLAQDVLGPQQPNALYESGAKILTPNADGNIFKMWFTGDGASGNLDYAESNDGFTWTRYASNPVITGSAYSKVYKHNGTYYCYLAPNGTFPPAGISVYTSPDGLVWTLAKANAIIRNPTVGTWNHQAVLQLNVVTVDTTGKWWAYYAGTAATGASVNWAFGLVTSTDGINWVDGGSNPVITYQGPSNFTWAQVGTQFYGWSQIKSPGNQVGGTGAMPSDIMRFTGPSPAGPWTPLGTPTYYRTLVSEGVGLPNGQVADPCLIQATVNGVTKTYMWYTSTPTGNTGNGYVINLATYPGTIAQLVQTYEGIVNIPIQTLAGLPLNLNTLVSDSGAGPDSNPIGGNWTPLNTSQFVASQRLSNTFQGTVAGKNSDSWYNAITWAADQWAQVTITECQAGSFCGVGLRMATNGTVNDYRCFWTGTTGNSGTWRIQKFIGGSALSVQSGFLVANVGDVLTGCVLGTSLLFYWNGFLLNSPIVDTQFATGPAGLMISPTTAVGNAEITNWSGGNFMNAPLLPPLGFANGSFLQGFRGFINKRGTHAGKRPK